MRQLSDTCGIYQLAEHHLEAVQALAGAPAIAATTRLPHPYPPDGARTFFATVVRERAAGSAYVFAIEDRKRVVGVIGLHGVTATIAELDFWIGVPHQRRGYASFAVRTVLPFAFQNLRLRSLRADVLATNEPSLRVLAKNGFVATGERAHDHASWPANVPLRRHELTAAAWREHCDGPALAALHPALRAILAAELAAGNAVKETGRGWPDADSVFVRLLHPFRALPSPLPDGVVHNVLNDPHWWAADLTTAKPRHTLAY